MIRRENNLRLWPTKRNPRFEEVKEYFSLSSRTEKGRAELKYMLPSCSLPHKPRTWPQWQFERGRTIRFNGKSTAKTVTTWVIQKLQHTPRQPIDRRAVEPWSRDSFLGPFLDTHSPTYTHTQMRDPDQSTEYCGARGHAIRRFNHIQLPLSAAESEAVTQLHCWRPFGSEYPNWKVSTPWGWLAG